MTTINGLIVLGLMGALLSGCPGAGEPVTPSESSDNFRVERLFTIEEGCTIYRFHDNGYAHYFTTCEGSTTTKRHMNTGKSDLALPEEIPTIELRR